MQVKTKPSFPIHSLACELHTFHFRRRLPKTQHTFAGGLQHLCLRQAYNDRLKMVSISTAFVLFQHDHYRKLQKQIRAERRAREQQQEEARQAEKRLQATRMWNYAYDRGYADAMQKSGNKGELTPDFSSRDANAVLTSCKRHLPIVSSSWGWERVKHGQPPTATRMAVMEVVDPDRSRIANIITLADITHQTGKIITPERQRERHQAKLTQKARTRSTKVIT